MAAKVSNEEKLEYCIENAAEIKSAASRDFIEKLENNGSTYCNCTTRQQEYIDSIYEELTA